MTRGLATVLAAALTISCGPSAEPSSPASLVPTARSATAGPLTLHAMSVSRNATPHEQILFEGGDANAFSDLRLLGPDAVPIASGRAVPRALEVMQMCPASKSGEPPPVYGALRVTLSLSSQAQLGDVIGHPERYRVEVFAHGSWQAAPFTFECHVQAG